MKIFDRFFQFNITLTQVVMDQVHFEIVDHLNAILQHGFLLLQRAMVVIYIKAFCCIGIVFLFL